MPHLFRGWGCPICTWNCTLIPTRINRDRGLSLKYFWDIPWCAISGLDFPHQCHPRQRRDTPGCHWRGIHIWKAPHWFHTSFLSLPTGDQTDSGFWRPEMGFRGEVSWLVVAIFTKKRPHWRQFCTREADTSEQISEHHRHHWEISHVAHHITVFRWVQLMYCAADFCFAGFCLRSNGLWADEPSKPSAEMYTNIYIYIYVTLDIVVSCLVCPTSIQQMGAMDTFPHICSSGPILVVCTEPVSQPWTPRPRPTALRGKRMFPCVHHWMRGSCVCVCVWKTNGTMGGFLVSSAFSATFDKERSGQMELCLRHPRCCCRWWRTPTPRPPPKQKTHEAVSPRLVAVADVKRKLNWHHLPCDLQSQRFLVFPRC